MQSLVRPSSSAARRAAAFLLVTTSTVLGQDVRVETPPPLLELELPNSKKLTISGELRWRAESRQNYDFRDNAGANPFFVGQRARVAFDFRVKDDVRAFLQVADTRVFGEETSTVDRSADGLDVHQAFLEWDVNEDLLLKIGRQEIELGEQRLISSLNWLDQARTLNGVVATYDTSETSKLIGFATILASDALQTDNTGAWVNGLYWTSACEGFETDLYTIALLDEETAANGTEHRWTFGTRLRQRFETGLFVGFEAATQVGELDNRDIPILDTYAIHADIGFEFADHEWKPRFMVEVDIASGNDPSSNDNERFNNLLPFAHAYWGQMDFAIWENMLHVSAQVEVKPSKTSKLRLSWHMFESMEPGDRFGGPVATLSNGVANGSDKMGNEVDLLYRHDLGSGIWGEAGASAFLPGSGVRDARGSDDTALFFYYMMGIKL